MEPYILQLYDITQYYNVIFIKNKKKKRMKYKNNIL